MAKKRHKKLNQQIKVIPKKKYFSKLDFSIFFFFIISLAYNQFVTLNTLSNVVNPISPFGSFSNFFKFLSIYGSRIFSTADLYFFIFIIFSSIYFLYREIKNNLFSGYISTRNFSNKQIIFALFIISVISLRYYFALGNNMHWGDASYFFAMTKSYYNSFTHLKFFPYFSYMSSAGNPFYIEYPPLFAYISALFNLVFGNIHTSMKVALFFFHFMFVAGVYLFIFEISKSKRTAFLSSLSAILLYFHAHISIYLGRYSSTPAWALFPFILLFLEKSLNKVNLKNFASLSLSVGLLILTNVGMAYIFLMPVIVYLLSKIVINFFYKDKLLLKKLLLLSIFFILGILIGGIYIYFVGFKLKETLFSGQSFSAMNVARTIKNAFEGIFIWNNYKIRFFNFPWQIAYWGISIIIFSIFGAVYLFKKKKNLPLLVVYLFEAFIVLTFVYFPLFKYIPFFYNYSIARYFYVLASIVIILSGFSYLFLIEKLQYNKNKIFIIMIFILLLDLFPTTFQDTFGKEYGGNAYPIFQYLKKNFSDKPNKANFRIDLIGNGTDPYVNQNWRPINAAVAEIGIPLLYDHSRCYELFGIFGNKFYQLYLKSLMREKQYLESDNFFKYYYLGNTRFIISSYPLNSANPFYKKVYRNKNIYFAELKYYSPVLFSQNIIQKKFANITNYDVYSLLNEYNINYSNNISTSIFITNSFETNLHYKSFTYKLIKHIVKDNVVYIKVKTSSPIYCRLSYTAYPNTKIFINNKNVSYYISSEGMIVIHLNKGLNKIDIIPKPNKILIILFILSLFAFILNIIILFWRKKKL